MGLSKYILQESKDIYEMTIQNVVFGLTSSQK